MAFRSHRRLFSLRKRIFFRNINRFAVLHLHLVPKRGNPRRRFTRLFHVCHRIRRNCQFNLGPYRHFYTPYGGIRRGCCNGYRANTILNHYTAILQACEKLHLDVGSIQTAQADHQTYGAAWKYQLIDTNCDCHCNRRCQQFSSSVRPPIGFMARIFPCRSSVLL